MSFYFFKSDRVKLKNTIKIWGIFFIFLFSSCSSKENQSIPEKPSLPILKLTDENQSVFSEYPASIEGVTNIEVRPQVSGMLTHIYVDEGAKVSKGQILFKIDDRPYVEQLNQANAQLSAMRAELQTVELEVDKQKQLVDNKVLTDFQLKTAIAKRSIIKANIQQAIAAVAAAKINLGFTTVRANTNGYIGRLVKKQGSLITPGDLEPLTYLSDIHNVRVYFSLSEQDFIAFKKENNGNNLTEILQKLPPVSLLLSDESDFEYSGKVDMIDGQFDKNTGAITLRATFPNPQGTIRNGNTGRIRIERKVPNVVLVPQSATLEIQDKVFVYTLNKENKVKQQPIKISGKFENQYLVEQGVKYNDRIVSKGFDQLKDGMIINPLN